MKDDDIVSNNSNNQTFQEIVEARVSRRAFPGVVLLLQRPFLSAVLMRC